MKPLSILLKTGTPATDKYFVDFGETCIPVKINKRRTSRRMIMRYQPLSQSLSLTLPERVSIKQGLHFINERREWVLRQLSQYSNTTSFSEGQEIPVLGRKLKLKHEGGRGVTTEKDGILHVHGDVEFMERRVEKWLINLARTEIITFAEDFSKKLGVKTGNISLRDTSSRWGSCSIDGNLSFCWRLVFAPREVLAYVVAHEVAHIREHNHSPKFWKLVAEIFPEYESAETWLKKHGKSLYMYGG